MDEQLDKMLREAGEELRARHDDAIIADVIGEVEAINADSAKETGEILRKMVGFEE
jgi:hypothetical protein